MILKSNNEPRRDLEKVEIKYLKKYVGRKPGRILDIGCGDGRITRPFGLKSRPIIGIDPYIEELKVAKQFGSDTKLNYLDYVQAHGETLPFATNSFSQVIFSWSL